MKRFPFSHLCPRFRPLGLAIVMGLPAWTPVAQAGSFSVSPVRIHMTPRERVVAVTIANEGETEVALQADLNTWTQSADGTDSLQPTDELILAPPIIRLAPKARQVVRLALVRPADAQRQLTYRLIVREVPEINQPPERTIQVPITLALSMPVFITPPGAKRELLCEVQRPDAKSLGASCINQGNAYAQVRGVTLRRGEQVLAQFEGGTYILPGARRFMATAGSATPPAPGPAEMELQLDDGTSQSQSVLLP